MSSQSDKMATAGSGCTLARRLNTTRFEERAMSQPILSVPLAPGQIYPADQILVCPRFDEKVQKGDGCWLWLANKTLKGYGQFSFNSHSYMAHRVSYQFVYGRIARKLFVCHACDNPTCVRPDHLFAGTHQDNIDDMMKKGRHGYGHTSLPGELNPHAELTESEVRLIRRLVELGIPQSVLAKAADVSFQHISDIVKRKKWAHVA